MSHQWNPGQYLKFAGHRLRPALDLLARIDADDAKTVFDLGCGAGNVTRMLAERWPAARVVGVDGSPEMLERARAGNPHITWTHADLTAWAPEKPADVLYSNAAMHWLPDHAALFPRLMEALKPGGTLAVQMPRNWGEPSHTCMREAAGPWLSQLAPVLPGVPVAKPEDYYGILAPVAGAIDIWETVYLQILEGDNAVAEWTKGSALKPVLDALDPNEREAYFEAYSALLTKAYPKRADGRTPFPFRRLFIVAER
ncbi:MAG: methyltransferase domain-containing protein [Rhodospirillales bacterium]